MNVIEAGCVMFAVPGLNNISNLITDTPDLDRAVCKYFYPSQIFFWAEDIFINPDIIFPGHYARVSSRSLLPTAWVAAQAARECGR